MAGLMWNIFGIADLISAPASAVIFGNTSLNFYPLVLVPLFIGPPFSILLHVASLRNFYLQKVCTLFQASKLNLHRYKNYEQLKCIPNAILKNKNHKAWKNYSSKQI